MAPLVRRDGVCRRLRLPGQVAPVGAEKQISRCARDITFGWTAEAGVEQNCCPSGRSGTTMIIARLPEPVDSLPG
jgi:hypothetical protein